MYDELEFIYFQVDKTGGSYYGKQSLSYGDVKGNSGNMAFSEYLRVSSSS